MSSMVVPLPSEEMAREVVTYAGGFRRRQTFQVRKSVSITVFLMLDNGVRRASSKT